MTTRPWSITVLLLTLLSPHLVKAGTITVKKVKGNSALVEMSAPLEAGKTYNLESDAITLTTDYASEFKSRLNSISLGLNVNILSGSKVVDNSAAFSGRYGWNHRTFEFGPTVDISVYDKGFGTNTDYLVGLYYDYNAGENKAPRDWVYGPTLQVALGNRNYDTGGSAQITQAELGGFMTWFINSSPVALRTEATYVYRRVNNSASETTLNGFTAQLYLMYYY